MLKSRSFVGRLMLLLTLSAVSFWAFSSLAVAQLPSGLKPQSAVPVVKALQEALTPLFAEEVQPGKCHIIDFSVTMGGDTKPTAKIKLITGDKNQLALELFVGLLDMDVKFGQNTKPWMVSKGGVVYIGKTPVAAGEEGRVLRYMDADSLQALEDSYALVNAFTAFAGSGAPDPSLKIVKDGNTLKSIGVNGAIDVKFNKIAYNVPQEAGMFDPPKGKEFQVETEDLQRALSALLSFAIDKFNVQRMMKPLRWDTSDKEMVLLDKTANGALFECQGKKIMFVEGTPEQMGTAQGTLLKDDAKKLMDRVIYVVGTGDSIASDRWFLDLLEEVDRRTKKYVDDRYRVEAEALGKACGVNPRNVYLGNLFPERFHCSGVAVRGKATGASDPKLVYHARVLDYMTDTLFQDKAVLQVFMPEGRNKWMSVGYAGFIGSVTAMNEKGLAIGEMGGGGGDAWDGMPFTYLFREIMETCSTVKEALALLKSKPLTCEYYYVFSDKTGDMVGLKCNAPDQVLQLAPGEQNPILPKVPQDTIMMSAGDRAELLSKRLHEAFGKIDAEKMIEIIDAPVSMKSNLHNAVMCPNTLDIWYADAGDGTQSCKEPYAHFNLNDLLKEYETAKAKK
ncbi:MAG: C45 family autoproteolytic acyltransferase/hydrolase [Thermoguttaceae bacterium]